jgi:hypothetical protein
MATGRRGILGGLAVAALATPLVVNAAEDGGSGSCKQTLLRNGSTWSLYSQFPRSVTSGIPPFTVTRTYTIGNYGSDLGFQDEYNCSTGQWVD